MAMTSRPLHVAGLLCVLGALMVCVQPIEAQGGKPKEKKTTTEVPKVDVTASEGSTATAQRGRPANPGAAKTVNAALKAALAKPAVRSAARAELLRQLAQNRPIAFADGYWVSAIKVASIYQLPQVRTELLAALGPDGAQFIGVAGEGPEGIIVAFTPAAIGRLIMGDLTRDLTSSLPRDLLEANTAGEITADNVIFSVSYGLGGLGTGMLVDWARYMMSQESGTGAPTNPNPDFDGDGIPDAQDDDDDNDGRKDKDDAYPKDSSKQICDCGRPAVLFGTNAAAGLLPTVVSALGASRAQLSSAVSLGPVVSGQSGSLSMVF